MVARRHQTPQIGLQVTLVCSIGQAEGNAKDEAVGMRMEGSAQGALQRCVYRPLRDIGPYCIFHLFVRRSHEADQAVADFDECYTEVIQSKGLEKITVDELVAEITPHGRGTCPVGRRDMGRK